MKMYGIPNCDTIKKAKKALEAQQLDYEFHDYKKLGISQEKLSDWCKQVGWEVLVNKRGTTWRKVDQDIKDNIDESSAIQLMMEQPSIIKRPVLESGDKILVGFDAAQYQQLG